MNEFINAPELLAPAGDRERFDKALYFGADAIYVGGAEFGMRTAPTNFSFEELTDAVQAAHKKNVKVYLTCNTVPRNNELDRLPSFIAKARDAQVDALIISDLGTMRTAKKVAPDVDIHVSTQAGITNYETANVFYDLGAKRIVTARELSLDDIAEMRAKIPMDMEIECFVHGAMCMSFSGRCLISNYLAGRDANRGDCAQPCRWKYHLMEETRPGEYFPIIEDDNGTYLMNSRDMCMIEHIPELISAGISSFKIEGRAKSAYYTAVITNAYRAAIDAFMKCENKSDFVLPQWISEEVRKVSYRQYCTGFYYGRPQDNAEMYYEGGYRREWNVVAEVIKTENGRLYGFQRNRFFDGDELEVMQKGAEPFTVKVSDLRDSKDEPIENAPHPMMNFSFKCDNIISDGAILRKKM
ncbi:MAG: U32 family peptidase [Clostridia bacterium]|nr:U32 family peptidase [Clostridia bacterium]